MTERKQKANASKGLREHVRNCESANSILCSLSSRSSMKKINILKTDLYASTLALGTDYFGSTVSVTYLWN